MGDTFDLERFVAAQDDAGTYSQALRELGNGRKTSHWMWFIFPQLSGLGRSPIAQHFAIASLDEARAYLRHPVLGSRLVESASVVDRIRERSAEQIFGSIDAQKLHSSMTLFLRANPDEPIFQRVLDRYFAGLPDAGTDRLL